MPGTQLFQREKVRVEPSAADHVSSRRRKKDLPASREKRRGEQNRRANLRAQTRIEIACSQFVRFYPKCIRRGPLRFRAYRLDELDQCLDVTDVRHVLEIHRLLLQESGSNYWQLRVLVAGRRNCSVEGTATLDDVLDGWHFSHLYGAELGG